MKRSDKPILVEDLAIKASAAKSVVVVDYQKMGTKQLNDLRQKITSAGGKFVVVKNTLVKLALEKAGKIKKDDAEIETGLTGPTAVVLAQNDEIAPLQVLGKSIKETELPRLKFGIFGNEIIDATKLLILSRLPGKNVLIGNLVGSLASPTYALVGTLNANLQKLVYVLGERQKTISTSQ